MVRMTRHLALALTVALVGVLSGLRHTGAALAQVPPDVEDQSQWLHNLWGTVTGPEYRWGQIITAGKTGTLDRVSLFLSRDTVAIPVPYPIRISIQTVTDAGLPSGTQIGFGMIPLTAIPSVQAPDWVDADIGGATVTAGARYALLVATGGGTIRWYADNEPSMPLYPGGDLVYRSDSTWGTIPHQDMTFRTWVIPPVLDQEQARKGDEAIVYHAREVGQVFTAGVSGLLDHVSLYLSNYSSSTLTGTTRVTLQTVTPAGLPSGTVLGSGSIPASAIPPGWLPTWIDVRISGMNGPVPMIAGSRYAIVLAYHDDTQHFLVWWDTNGNIQDWYPAGYEVENEANAGWQVRPYANGWDTMFRTYVTLVLASSEPPGPGPTTPARNYSQDCTERVEPRIKAFLAPFFAPDTYDLSLSHGACVAALSSRNVTALAAELCREPRIRARIAEVLGGGGGGSGPLNHGQCVQRLKPALEQLLKDVLGAQPA